MGIPRRGMSRRSSSSSPHDGGVLHRVFVEFRRMMDGQILTPWVDRRWRFDFPAELYPAVIERLRGLPARARELASSLPPGTANIPPQRGWSVQRHLGHLTDLEDLLAARLDAYERCETVLPAADMSNARSVAADHDARQLEEVLGDLRAARMK